MRRGMSGDSVATQNSNHNNNTTLDTINAAASMIASAENRVHQATVQKRRWGGRWSMYWCFGHQKNKKRIRHAVVLPESSDPRSGAPASDNPTQASSIVLPFVAPPSSPASFFQSEPPSVTQSPAGVLSLTSISANMYSPGGPSSIFAIGPYAHETQLVSPPVFSTFTTEPSTAPFTPPPESVHLTTPSSPEVPFAQLLDPSLRNNEAVVRFPFTGYEFQSYQLYPGSPVGQLISPSSGISGSGTSSPFPDGDFVAGGPQFLEFRMGGPPKLEDLDKFSPRDWGSRYGAGTLAPDTVRLASRSFLLDQFSDTAARPQAVNGTSDSQVGDHRVSFELTAEDDMGSWELKPQSSHKTTSESLGNGSRIETEETSGGQVLHTSECLVGETSNVPPEKPSADSEMREEAPRHQKHRSLTLGSLKDFDFDHADGGGVHKPDIGPDWWANGSVVGKESGDAKNWSFFPVMQPSVS